MTAVGIEARNASPTSRRPHPDGAPHGSRRNREERISAISLRKKKTTAASVPTWRSRSKASSGSLSPRRRWARNRCPELLTGRNSVAPWRRPRRIAWRRVTRGPSLPGPRPGFGDRALHHLPDPRHGRPVPPLEAQNQHGLGVGGPDQPPPAVEQGADAVHPDDLACPGRDDLRHLLHHPELD